MVVEDEKGLAEFYARPMPVFEDGLVGVPARKPPTPTQVKPFALQADQRGAVKQERFKHQMDEESKADAMRRKFHAQSDQVVHKTPFVPEKSQKPLTELSNLTLNTEVKASQRHEYNQQRKMMEEEMLAAKKLEEERRAADELAEVTQLRKEVVHKAQPMPKFKQSVIQPAPHMPTVPTSPNFATKSRLESRSRANSTLTL
ncbi:Targeting protein for Xklp2 [Chionoecetes opilio]|uniref:Targeting protein for Xklp2 n=1 Tax=Chionoecetes opilio TaxID=41210 RepID=A0A8J5CZV5_CHIOP|nr:Targeting protein for Xklp2 [Chionoecetes opilio]